MNRIETILFRFYGPAIPLAARHSSRGAKPFASMLFMLHVNIDNFGMDEFNDHRHYRLPDIDKQFIKMLD